MVMGKSATGKDTIFKELQEISELKLKSVVGYTTRPIRKGETEGVEYFFVTEDELQELRQNNKVIEHRAYETMHGVWNYFTVDDGQINLNDSNYLLIGTLEAYEQIKNYYGADVVVPICIEVEDGIRLKRAFNRERKQEYPKYAELCRRFLADDEDFSEKNYNKLEIYKRYQNVDINICLLQIVNDIKAVMLSDRSSI